MSYRGLIQTIGIATFISAACSIPSSYAGEKLLKTPCLQGETSDRAEEARKIFFELVPGMDPPADLRLADLLEQTNLPRFEHDLGVQMRRRRCGFDKHALFTTVAQVKSALSEHWFKLQDTTAIPPYIKEGFVAILGTPSSDDLIVIETTSDGFIFRECKADEEIEAGKRCKSLGNSSVFVPVEALLKKTSGLKRDILIALRTLAGVAIVGAASFADAAALPLLVIPITEATNDLFKPEPLAELRKQRAAKKVAAEILLMGKIDAATSKSGTVSRMIPFIRFEDLREATLDVIMTALTDEWKELGKLRGLPLKASSAYAAQYGFHQQVLEFYAKEKAAEIKNKD